MAFPVPGDFSPTKPLSEADAYVAGWQACMAGCDGRYEPLAALSEKARYAWRHGWLDAMDAGFGEEPEPAIHGY